MTVSLKQKLHTLIDKIENESILNELYQILTAKSTNKEGLLWGQLSPEQQNEVLQSLIESQDPLNLISNEKVKRNHIKWL